MKQVLIILFLLLNVSQSVITVLDKSSVLPSKPPLQTEKLPWQSHFVYQSSTEYYNEHELDENEFIERRNPVGFTTYNSLCPQGETGLFPYPPDCRRFINCWKGRGSIQVCSPATLFNSKTRECDHPSKVRCKNNNQADPFFEEGERYVRFPHQRPNIAYNPRVGRNQINDKTIPAKPYPGRPPYFGPSHLKPPTNSKLSNPQCPAGATGLYPHPRDCSKFIKCWSGGTFVQNCGPGTLFNPRISACDHPHNVACGQPINNYREENLNVNVDVQEPEESVQNERFEIFNGIGKGETTQPELKTHEILPNSTKETSVLYSLKSDKIRQNENERNYETTESERHPKIINAGSKEKPLVENKVSTHLTPPQSGSFQLLTSETDQFNSNSSDAGNFNQSSKKKLSTHYPSHGPYSQLSRSNYENQGSYNAPHMDSYAMYQQEPKSRFTHHFYPRHPYSYNHHQQHRHHPLVQPQIDYYGNLPSTGLRPPPIPPQQTGLYAPNYPAEQNPIQFLQKAERCNSKVDSDNANSPSEPMCEYINNFHRLNSRDSNMNSYSYIYPYWRPKYQNTAAQPFPSSDIRASSPNLLPFIKANVPYVSSHSLNTNPSQSSQMASVYNSNIPPGSQSNSETQTNLPHSQRFSSTDYYPFYHLQDPLPQKANDHNYFPQISIPAASNAPNSYNENLSHQYPSHYNPTGSINQYANAHSTNWNNPLEINRESKPAWVLYPKMNVPNNNFKAPEAPVTGLSLENKHNTGIATKHPSKDIETNYDLSENNREKGYILNKLHARNGEEKKYNDNENATQSVGKDVESIDVLMRRPDKYSQPSERDALSSSQTPPASQKKKSTAVKTSLKIRETPPSGQLVRLRNGASHLDGYLEMKNDQSQWGLVCDKVGAWNIEEANVACRELGFVRGAELSWQGYPIKSNEETVQVAVEVINCTGSETSLSDCKIALPSAGGCNVARNAVGLRCFDNLASHCQPGEILYNRHCYKLHGKENLDDPGIKTEEASDSCRRYGGKLVDITSQYENDFISEWLIKKYPEVNSVITGGIGISVLGRPMWIWEGTNDPMIFERWWSGWTGKQKIPEGSINGPMCIVLKKTYSCNDTEDSKIEKEQEKEEETCSTDYFFWDAEDCNRLRTAVYICKRPMDDIGCIIGAGEGYLGTANTTASGQACLPWDHPKVVEGLARRTSLGERSARLAGHNYCRNLGDPDRHPWCFVEGKGNSEYCAIPQCWDSVSGYHRSYEAFSSCDENHFECKPGECVKKAWVCDGQKDCSNNRDEEMCKVFYQEFKAFKNKKMKSSGKEKWENVNENMCSKFCLQNKSFKCRSFSYSLKGKFCLLSDKNIGLSGQVVNENGWVYHELISESLRCTMENDFFECLNGKCVNISNVCDGKENCDDGSDERDCGKLGYEIRLGGSMDKHKGRVEVKILGKWGVVCDDMFDLRDANVVCKELGFPMGAAEVLQHSYYPLKDPLFLIDDLDCFGNETSIRECPFPGWGKHNCGIDESVGVVCRVTGFECANGQWRCKNSQECISVDYLCDDIFDCDDKSDENDESCRSATQIRLSDGPDVASGRLEIRHFGVWGTVCDDDFNVEAAKVVCSLLGYNGSAEVKKNAYFGAGKGPIWLDEVHCTGKERSLEECAYPHWGKNNCKHDEDVGVICGQLSERISTAFPPIASASVDDSVSSKEEKMRKALIFECGGTPRSSPRVNSYERVVGGTNVARESVPWQASIRVKSGGGKSIHWCGAIVISPFHILTAGHCLRDYNKAAYFIRVGDYDTEVHDDQEQEFAIDHLYMHTNFSKQIKLNNDIGLVKIKGEISFNDQIKPACLASSLDMYIPGTNCTVSGWGSVSANSAGFARTLRRGHVPILEPSICRAPFVYDDNLSEGMFCAGQLDGGVDSCQGDSGGPLTCNHHGKEYLFGITSWGHGCGRANKPGVYTNVAYYAEWIEEKMRASLA